MVQNSKSDSCHCRIYKHVVLFWASVYMYYCNRGHGKAFHRVALGYLTCMGHADLESSHCNTWAF
jgi:hypothetical protein